ncbi:MAG: hypothetical protein JWP85_522 [Rhodoglobus sp.]|nr:hypothetical protein [Rhodoglobus sp.]
MEDGPESAEGNYPYRDKTYRLVEADSERWDVFDGDIYLGVLVAVPGEGKGEVRSGPLYTLDFAGEENKYDEPATDDWRLVLEYLIDHADESDPDRPGHNEPAGTP